MSFNSDDRTQGASSFTGTKQSPSSLPESVDRRDGHTEAGSSNNSTTSGATGQIEGSKPDTQGDDETLAEDRKVPVPAKAGSNSEPPKGGEQQPPAIGENVKTPTTATSKGNKGRFPPVPKMTAADWKEWHETEYVGVA
ncbi:hypothetical protein QFC24_006639 [Naganishia onofrii]|uniref:Uncharacterized protein n=1 Tax=Naganishia onofrii TaxID=1851511 RepID=A0ACC2X0D5_9TREE|nr:hypothetical protein QFC24_006639 [Naganishia onofrii]